MAFAGYKKVPAAWEKLLEKSNTKSKEHIFALIIMWGSSEVMKQIDGLKTLDTHIVTWSQIHLAAIAMAHAWLRMMVSPVIEIEENYCIYVLQICF
jgi:hypothetical protein